MRRYLYIILILSAVFTSGCDRVTSSVDTADDGLPPAVPSGLGVYAANDGIIIIRWDDNYEPDLEGYTIFRSVGDSLNFSEVSFSSVSHYTDDSLDYDKKYYYRISAKDIYGRQSLQSQSVSAEPKNKYPPAQVRQLYCYGRNWPDSLAVLLEWERNYYPDIKEYLIYRSESADFTLDTTSFLGVSGVNSYIDRVHLKTNLTYYYKVLARDRAGLTGKSSSEASAVIYATAEAVEPSDGSTTGRFEQFVFKSVGVPARYRVVLQSNEYFEDVWTSDISVEDTSGVVSVQFNSYILRSGRTYYWRVITFNPGSDEPNSISRLYRFYFKAE